MNFLAHLFLSEDSPEARIGNLMGDFVKSNALGPFPLPMQRGVILHQKIDTFTDTHPVFLRSRQRISLERRRYASILIDIFYDHFLAVYWSQYASLPLPEFAQSIYAALRVYDDILPNSLRYTAAAMMRNDWLMSYRDLSGIQQALARVSRQLRRPNDLALAVSELEGHYQPLEDDFRAFFPDLIAYVNVQIAQNS